jgi:poly-beta-1,6-N-acetyl-D-glucosamine N-deacetylase
MNRGSFTPTWDGFSEMKRWMSTAQITIILLFAWTSVSYGYSDFVSLCYHNIKSSNPEDPDFGEPGLNSDIFIAQMEWLLANGYHFINWSDILSDKCGGEPLPEKSILITFDDGFRSLYQRVYPLLKQYDIPAIAAVVGNWLEETDGTNRSLETKPAGKTDYLGWNELKEMVQSGLIEVASHTYDMHRGLPANPQGNCQPAATALIFDQKTHTYESDADYVKRVREDLEKNSKLIERHLGKRPRIMVWPYGEYNERIVNIARKLGMSYSLGLNNGSANTADLTGINRFNIGDDETLEGFVRLIQSADIINPVRAVQVDLDYIFDPDPDQTEKNLGCLLDRIQDLGVNTVILQAFADPDGDGIASELYYANRHLPVRCNLFNRVAWQLRTRCNVAVYAWLPVLSYAFPDPELNRDLHLADTRLSPFKQKTQQLIGDIYEDLGRASPINGLFFHDDAVLLESERPQGQLKDRFKRARKNSEDLCDFTEMLEGRIRQWRSPLKTMRNLFARVAMYPSSEIRFGQNMALFLEHYDWIAVMAMPYLESAASEEVWFGNLVKAVSVYPGALDKTVFEIQTRNWKEKTLVPNAVLIHQIRTLWRSGARHFAYYPDDLHRDHPSRLDIRKVMSSSSYPFGKP